MFGFKRYSFVLLTLAVIVTACSAAGADGSSERLTPPPVTIVATVSTQASAPGVTAQATVQPEPTPQTAPQTAPQTVATAPSSSTPASLSPIAIEALRARDYPGSDIVVEQTLAPGANYRRYVVSYRSDGLKIYALMTVPSGARPATGWPVLLFNHGYIAPEQYRTTERYVAYQDALARAGYITFKSDYRGHGDSEGTPSGHFGPGYTIDVLNGLASLKRYPEADPNRIGMWGHSMGGEITLRAMVVSKDIKAGVSWSGTVGAPADMLNPGQHGGGPGARNSAPYGLGALAAQYGSPDQNPEFWNSISANAYLADLSGPLQLHHSVADAEVPFKYSRDLYDQALQVGKPVELYEYPGNDHNLANSFSLAMQRTIAFFDQYVKGDG